ncbi:ArpU family transcriptional regulator [Bacillus sp. FJAT-49705]|uniref:ArpU family transcriptional regulator n=1 Tax=Cytobacillus citreus TaxID=2833586 RepID=A0ABS5NVA2_9BACI|nr:ArpU family phage packaging/lysis transcriptional regulator [Cytobacillus citreus]MBS4191760.1 ArpU family transcriptional regulator [Cytobacillus citreus]
MKKQLSFYLPVVDEKDTRKKVEKELYEYRQFLLTLPSDFLPAITASYSLLPPVNNNQFHSSTEDAAIERAEFERARNKFMSVIHTAVNSLKQDERFVIIKCFMEHHLGYDPDIWTELGIGKTKYYQLKGEAMLRLAFALRVEVYKKKKEVRSA